MPTTPRHLVTVWNPAYASEALEAHLRLLLDWDARVTASQASDDDCYVWWGKVRSPQRQQPMPHLADVLALGAAAETQADDDPRETHLYLTDFRSLYVADVGLITTNDVARRTRRMCQRTTRTAHCRAIAGSCYAIFAPWCATISRA